MNRLAIQALPKFTSSHIVYLDPNSQLIDQVNISTGDSKNISLRDGTIKCTDWSTICCFTLKGQKIWDFKDQSVLRKPKGIALDKNSNVYVAGMVCYYLYLSLFFWLLYCLSFFHLRILFTPIDNFNLFLLFASMNIKEILLTCDFTTINQ